MSESIPDHHHGTAISTSHNIDSYNTNCDNSHVDNSDNNSVTNTSTQVINNRSKPRPPAAALNNQGTAAFVGRSRDSELKWLNARHYSSDYYRHLGQRISDETGLWFLRLPQFREWVVCRSGGGHRQILFCDGIRKFWRSLHLPFLFFLKVFELCKSIQDYW